MQEASNSFMIVLTMELNQISTLSRWQIPLLILMLLTSCSAQSTYYVTPTPDTPCPGEPCHILSEYVAGQYFNNLSVNITMEFLPGNHTLEQTITVRNLTWLTLHGDSSSLPEVTSRIVCTLSAGFIFTGIAELHISALAFTACSYDGRAAVNMISVPQANVSNCMFQNNVNIYSCDYSGYSGYGDGSDCNGGGALYVQNSYVILTVNKFQHNSAFTGGALQVDKSTINLTRNTFQNNSAGYGGALYVADIQSALHLTENTFQKNPAVADGGALYVEKIRVLYLRRNTFQNNSAGGDGGVLYLDKSFLSLTGNTLQNNSAGGDGGVLYLDKSFLSLTGNTLQNNSAAFGGGALSVHKSILLLTGNTFQSNSAMIGGTLYMCASSLILTESDYFTDSHALVGGAILETDNSTLKMYNTTIGNNRAQYGGGMAAVDSRLEVYENTFENNTASYGGGLFVHHTEFYGNAIFTKNSVTEGGGGIYASRSTFFLMDNTTIITNNVAMDGGGMLLSGDSKLYQQPGIAVHLISNSAKSTGGAIRIEESNPLTYCITTDRSFDVSNSDCFFQIQHKVKALYSFSLFKAWIDSLNISHTMYFDNNSAVEAGADLYGGSVDSCTLNNVKFKYSSFYFPGSIDILHTSSISGYIFGIITSTENKPAISSDPLHICTCRDGVTNCNDSYHPKPVYPGGTGQW